MTIELVMFDIGNVLIEWNPERFYDRAIGRARREALFAEVDLDAMNAGVDLGDPFREAVYALAEAHPKWHDEIRLWHDRWIEMASPAIDRSVRLLRALRARGVPVQALTNFGVDSFDVAAAAYPFLNEFDRRYISGHLRCMKPDAAIYEVVERECGHAPGAILFTDDRADNIATAAGRGWNTHLFDGPDGWAARLVAEGLLTEEKAR